MREKNLIIHCPTQESWNRVIEKAISEGYKFMDIKEWKEFWIQYRNQNCIILNIKDYCTYSPLNYWKTNYSDTEIMTAEKFLDEVNTNLELKIEQKYEVINNYPTWNYKIGDIIEWDENNEFKRCNDRLSQFGDLKNLIKQNILKEYCPPIEDQTTIADCIIHTPTIAQFGLVQEILFKNGCKWAGNGQTRLYNAWHDFSEKTHIMVKNKILFYNILDYFKQNNNNSPILTFHKFNELYGHLDLRYDEKITNFNINNKPKEKSMLQTLTAKIRRFFVSAEKRKLYRAGYMGECGELTSKGWDVLKLILSEKFEKELAAEADEEIKDELAKMKGKYDEDPQG